MVTKYNYPLGTHINISQKLQLTSQSATIHMTTVGHMSLITTRLIQAIVNRVMALATGHPHENGTNEQIK